jgi:tRNA-binding protein
MATIQPDTISFADFQKVDIRVGRIIHAEPSPDARVPAYKLRIDFGPLGERTSSAQVTDLYGPDDLTGREVLAVVNFPPKRVARVLSEVLVLGLVPEDGQVVLVGPDRDVEPGTRLA